MGREFASWSLLLHLLFIMCAHGIGARAVMSKKNTTPEELMDQNNVLRLPSMEDDHHDEHEKAANQENDAFHDNVQGNPSPHKQHMDPVLSYIFTMKDLKVGKIIPIYFRKVDPTSPQFLPREIAESIPFSTKELPHLLELLSLSQGSRKARQMEETLRICESKPGYGETRFCATSLESLIDFVRDVFGAESHFHVLSTRHLTESETAYQNYTIHEMPKEIRVAQVIACHPITYPYAVFFCHMINQTKAFQISLEGENGDAIEALAACHMDTSKWDPNNVGFRVLGTKPGASEVCHFFPADNLVWVPRVHI